jgi:2-desacetyl-2-hydroxyethyl bacteriochlorophyllide A dehydrogenase
VIRAAVLRGPRRVEIDEVELPEPADGELVVRVEACGICATNLQPWADPERVVGGSALPGTLGHEAAGVVERAGPAVRDFAPGDRVCLEPTRACGCGVCEACLSGDAVRCRDLTMLPVWGFAERIVVPERGLVAAPARVDAELACLCEPLACAVHGIRHSWTASRTGGRIDGLRVAVLGGGVVGLFALTAARHLGAAEVTVVARHEHQARAAEALGASAVLRESPETPAQLRRLRPQLVVEAVGGRAPTLAQAFATVDRGGEVVVLGLFDEPAPVDARSAVMRNVHAFFAVAYGSLDGVTDFSVALEILAAPDSGLDRLVTHRFPLAQADEAFRVASDKASGALRVVLRP